MAIEINACGSRNPNAVRVINRLLVFIDSILPLVSPCLIEARIRSLCFRMRCWSFTNAGIRHRLAQDTHRAKASVASSKPHLEDQPRPLLLEVRPVQPRVGFLHPL